uniref:Uncharacterized protein n=1 Tax=Acrobeloides nanus TaxID=290746 RepID=A0A914E3G3_9BILA
MMALALNRICEITWRTGADMFFRRNRVHFWILLSILNGIVAALFTPLSDYSTRYLTYAHDYFAGTQGLGGSDVMTINSAAICLESLAATLFFYITFTFFNPPDEVVILGQLIWIMEHGMRLKL